VLAPLEAQKENVLVAITVAAAAQSAVNVALSAKMAASVTKIPFAVVAETAT